MKSHAAYIDESCHTYKWVMSHIWISHAAYLNESTMQFVMHEWVMLHVWRIDCFNNAWMSYESCHAYKCVTLHIWMSWQCIYDCMNESCCTHKWTTAVIMHEWVMSHVTHMNASCSAHLSASIVLVIMQEWNHCTYEGVMILIIQEYVAHMKERKFWLYINESWFFLIMHE